MKNHIVIAGGHGFIGQGLKNYLKQLCMPYVILSRNPQGDQSVYWDGQNAEKWISVLDHAKAIVNVTGKSINCRLTRENKKEILASRLNPIRALAEGIKMCENPPKIWIQAASVGIYPDEFNTPSVEASPPGNDFLAHICQTWESEFLNLSVPDLRQVILRIGWVLGKNGGVLLPLVRLTKNGLGGRVASGRQRISWIHQEDLNFLITDAINTDRYQGIYNAVTPQPVSNAEFMYLLREQLRVKIGPPIPKPFVYIGALFMGTSASLALSSKTCFPERLNHLNFPFKYTDLSEAFKEVLT